MIIQLILILWIGIAGGLFCELFLEHICEVKETVIVRILTVMTIIVICLMWPLWPICGLCWISYLISNKFSAIMKSHKEEDRKSVV